MQSCDVEGLIEDDEVRKRMRDRPPERTLTSTSLPMAMLGIGIWEDDVRADRIRGDAVMAAMYGLTEAEFEQGLSWARFSSLFHPDDLRANPAPQRHVRDGGGMFVWEHRIVPAPGVIRWVLARGHFERDAVGRMYGRGIVVDVTDSRIDDQIDGPARFVSDDARSGATLERIADRAIKICELIQTLEADKSIRLGVLIDALLHELGRQLAASLEDEPPITEQRRCTNIH